MTRLRSRAAATGGGILLAVAGAAVATLPGGAPAWPTATVQHAPFVERLIERGAISAARLMLYGSRIPGSAAKIVELVREGTPVAPGDVLIRFDTAGFSQERARELAALDQARADLTLTREALRLETLQATADLERAEQQIGFAEATLADETEGAGRVTLADLESTAAEAAREVTRAQSAYDDLKPMLAEEFITAIELERAEQRLRQATEQEALARLRRDTFVRYGRPAAVGRAKVEVGAARDDLARQTDTAAARLTQRRAAVRRAEGTVREVEARIALVDERLAQAVVIAEGPGLVVYRDLFFGGDRRKPRVGDEVWPNQPVMALPDSSRLVVDTRVREVDLHKIATGQQVLVTVEAYPDLRLNATVELVGALAEDDATRAGVKYFPVTVALIDVDPRLRTGMTARVGIEVASRPNALVVPVHAIFEDETGSGETYCVVLRNGRPQRVDVQVGANNGLFAAVTSGLAQGDEVLLVDPTTKDVS